MRVLRLPLPLLGLLVCAVSLQAGQNEAYVTVSPDALPSASLQPFLATHLDRILAPLGKEEFDQPWIVTALRANYDTIMVKAPDNRKPAFAAAELVCNALANAMTERLKAVDIWHGSAATHSSAGDQPRGGRADGRAYRGLDDDFFRRSAENDWNQRTVALRENILRLNRREQATEALTTAKLAPTAAPAAGAVSAAATPPSAVLPSTASPSSAQAADPVVGPWLLEGRSPLMLAVDHTISGSREGIWTYTCTTGGGRNYELHWTHKDWVDYLVLSSDGKSLDGHTRNQKPISASRP